MLPVRDGLPYVREAIASILAQSDTDFELIVSDNHSADGTREAVGSFTDPRVRLVCSPQPLSIAASHRFATEHARTEYVAFMGADDIAEPQRIERQVAALDSDEALVVVGSWCHVIGPDGEPIGIVQHPVAPDEVAREIMHHNSFVFPSIMVRRAAYDQAGGIRDDCDAAFDYDLFLRMLRVGRGANIPEYLLRYRFHSQMDSLRRVKTLRWNAIRARWQALRRDRHVAWHYLWLVPPLTAAILPAWVLRALAKTRLRVYQARRDSAYRAPYKR